MPGRPRKFSLVALAALALMAFAGCGDSHTRVTTGTYAGESGANAPYLNVGPLTYEVQLSRQLSPFDTEDAAYLEGLSPIQRALTPEQEWFAVTIADTQGKVYTPLTPDASNRFAYRAGTVPAKGRLPVPYSIAAAATTQGVLLLYKIQIASLNNRPLTLRIADPTDASRTASAELDV